MQSKKAQAIIMIAELAGVDLSESRLRAYLLALEDLTADELGVAFKHFSRDPKLYQMPNPGSIREKVRPQLSTRQEAIRTIDVVKKAITKFGWPQPDKARAELGESTWAIVERLGGWQRVCEDPDLYLDNPTVYAQTRDKVEAQVTSIRTGINYDRLPGSAAALKLEQGQSEPMSIGEILKLAKPKKDGE